MNDEINTEDINQYFEDQTYTPEEEQLLSDGFIEGKVYHGVITERIPKLTTNPDKFTEQQMPMLLYKINFMLENNKQKELKFTIVFYPKDHAYHWMTKDNKEKFKRATGVDVLNAFASDSAFIGKEVDATLKKKGKFTEISFVDKDVVDEMKQAGQNMPDGKQKSFDDDIPF